jgi:hypothetical protein
VARYFVGRHDNIICSEGVTPNRQGLRLFPPPPEKGNETTYCWNRLNELYQLKVALIGYNELQIFVY